MKGNVPHILFIVLGAIVLAACGTKGSQMAEPTVRTTQEWTEVGDYDVLVHEFVDETDSQGDQRVIFINVEYANNRSNEALSCRKNQWYLYDDQGYSYEAGSKASLYDDKNLQYLGGERFITLNKNLRGWLAFEIPDDAVVDGIQFITGFLGTESVDIFVKN